MVGAEQDAAAREGGLGGVGEAGSGGDGAEVAEGLVPGDGGGGDDHAEVEEGELGGQPGGAGVALGGEGLVVGRGALDRGGDVAAAEGEAVVAGHRGRLVGEDGAVEAGEQPVAGAVAGEDAAGAVAAVGGRGQAEDEQAGRRVAEAGDRAAPVLLVAEGGPLLPGHLLAPGDQPGAAAALGHLGGQAVEALAGWVGGRGCGARHGGTVASGSWAREGRPTWPRCCGRGWPPPASSLHPVTPATSNATSPSTSNGSPPWPPPPTSTSPTPPRRPGRRGSGRGVWTTEGAPHLSRLPSRVGAPPPELGVKLARLGLGLGLGLELELKAGPPGWSSRRGWFARGRPAASSWSSGRSNGSPRSIPDWGHSCSCSATRLGRRRRAGTSNGGEGGAAGRCTGCRWRSRT